MTRHLKNARGRQVFLKRHLENRSLEDELIKKILSLNTRIFGKSFLGGGGKVL